MENNFGFTKQEYDFLKKLNQPAKIQDFLDSIPYNLQKNPDTCYSPKKVLEHRVANCREGAIFASAALRVHGHKPLIIDLVAAPDKDDDHEISVFKRNSYWGAIAKSKFTGLQFRDPVYKNVRELVMSYFDDYYNERGEKSLREYSKPVNLSMFDEKGWMTSEKDVWFILEYLVDIKHVKILGERAKLRKADNLLLKAGMLSYPKH